MSAALDRVVTEVSSEGQLLSTTVSEDGEGTTQILGKNDPGRRKGLAEAPELLRVKQKDA